MTNRSPRAVEKTVDVLTGAQLSAEGQAVARLDDGRVLFVRDAAPNERVRVVLEQDKKKFARGRVLEVLEPSPDRVEPECAAYDRCGGCQLQHVSAAAQLASKQQSVLDRLERIGKVDLTDVTVDGAWSGPAYGYRGRARWTAKAGAIGYLAEKSRRVTDVEDCPILVPALRSALTVVRAERAPKKRNPRRGRPAASAATFHAVAVGGEALVAADRRHALRTRVVEIASATEVAAASKSDAGASAPSGSASAPDALALDDPGAPVERVRIVVPGSTSLPVHDGLGTLSVAPGVFSQSNQFGNPELVREVRARVESLVDGAEAGPLIELYAGSGNLTRVLEPFGAPLVTYEVAAEAVALSVAAGREPGQALTVEAGLAKTLADGITAPLIVANPGRDGFSDEATAALLDVAPSAVVYVSCNPSTLARDLSRWAGVLRLERVRVFDLYPQTTHVEVVATLRRV